MAESAVFRPDPVDKRLAVLTPAARIRERSELTDARPTGDLWGRLKTELNQSLPRTEWQRRPRPALRDLGPKDSRAVIGIAPGASAAVVRSARSFLLSSGRQNRELPDHPEQAPLELDSSVELEFKHATLIRFHCGLTVAPLKPSPSADIGLNGEIVSEP